MRKKEEWEKREIKSASFSLKNPKSLFIDRELITLSSMSGFRGWTDINKEFLIKESNLNEKDFEELVWKFILEKANIKEREYAKKFRKFLAEKIMKENKREEVQKRMKDYVEKEQYL